MQNVYDSLYELDRRCYELLGLSEDLLMENAARGMKEHIKKEFAQGSSVLVVAGSGNNGADGIALARMLHLEYSVLLFLSSEPKSEMAKLQLLRAKKTGVKVVDKIEDADIVVDAMFGMGLTRKLEREYPDIIKRLNSLKGYKLACDMPSGLLIDGRVSDEVFEADVTITMGAYKKALFSDLAKMYVGRIECVEVGVSRKIYECESRCFVLEMSDLKLPLRKKSNTHKGSYGHLGVLCGEKEGASIISSLSALSFGVGLCTIIKESKPQNLPLEVMYSDKIPSNTTAIAIGMGLGRDVQIDESILKHKLVVDADMFFNDKIEMILSRCEEVVLTPHPKEFSELLKRCSLGEFTVKQIQEQRFALALELTQAYPNVVLVLKGANTIIAKNDTLYINPHGTQALAKGGSGDVLSGLIGALLAQGYDALDAAITASLAHVKASISTDINNYALMPLDIVEQIKKL
ncbi:MAG: NAD(P)H-hydrate dehydratase [Campylobacterales bacterium]